MTSFARRTFACALLGFVLPAFAMAGKKEDLLQADVDEIQRQVFDLKRQLDRQGESLSRLIELLDGTPEARAERARFNANVEALRTDLRALGSRFDDVAQRLGDVERGVTACQNAIRSLPAAATAASPPTQDNPLDTAGSEQVDEGSTGRSTSANVPNDGARPADTSAAEAIFKQASGDYLRGNLELALGEFRNYLQLSPDGEHAPEARYGIAMSLIKQRKFDEAVRELDTLFERHPRAANVPDALYRKGESLLSLNRVGQAVLVFNDVVSRFPETAAATQASERLRELASEAR